MKKWRMLIFLTLFFTLFTSSCIIALANDKEYIREGAYVEYINLYYSGMMIEQKGVRVIEERHENIVDKDTLEIYVPARIFSVMSDNCEVLWNAEERKVTFEIAGQDSYASYEYTIGSNIMYFNWIEPNGDNHKQTFISQNPIFIHNGAAMIPSGILASNGLYTWRSDRNNLCYYDHRADYANAIDYKNEITLEAENFLAGIEDESRRVAYRDYLEYGLRQAEQYRKYLGETYDENNVDKDEWIALEDLAMSGKVLVHKIESEWILTAFNYDLKSDYGYSNAFEHILGGEFHEMYYSQEDFQDKFNGLGIIKRNNKYFLNRADLVTFGLKLK